MKKFFTIFFSTILFLCSLSAEDPYDLHLASVVIDPENPLKGKITLSNGSIWNWSPTCNCCKGKLDDWKEGDPLKIGKIQGKEYGILNLSVLHRMNRMTLDESTLTVFPTIEKVDDNAHYLLLSDGSLWYIGWWSSQAVKDWKVGEHILVTQAKTIGEATHILFNLHREKSIFWDTSSANATLR